MAAIKGSPSTSIEGQRDPDGRSDSRYQNNAPFESS